MYGAIWVQSGGLDRRTSSDRWLTDEGRRCEEEGNRQQVDPVDRVGALERS